MSLTLGSNGRDELNWTTDDWCPSLIFLARPMSTIILVNEAGRVDEDEPMACESDFLIQRSKVLLEVFPCILGERRRFAETGKRGPY
jgi:hypothetical protein